MIAPIYVTIGEHEHKAKFSDTYKKYVTKQGLVLSRVEGVLREEHNVLVDGCLRTEEGLDVASIVLDAWVGKKPSDRALAFKDGDASNVCLSNLAYKSEGQVFRSLRWVEKGTLLQELRYEVYKARQALRDGTKHGRDVTEALKRAEKAEALLTEFKADLNKAVADAEERFKSRQRFKAEQEQKKKLADAYEQTKVKMAIRCNGQVPKEWK